MIGYNMCMARPSKTQATDFGKRLALARSARGFTQIQLAERLGMSQQMINYYERRAGNPTAAFIRKAAETLNVSINDLISDHSRTTRKLGPPSQFEQRLLSLRQLPREKQKMALQFLDSFLRDTQQVGV